jgi:hypothetical protein
MLEGRKCRIALRNGDEIQADRVLKTSITIKGMDSGEILVLVGSDQRTICLDDIEDIQ